jgi:hypothetical protein
MLAAMQRLILLAMALAPLGERGRSCCCGDAACALVVLPRAVPQTVISSRCVA